jgi:branched-chain amino acid transport system substrate-binding protein
VALVAAGCAESTAPGGGTKSGSATSDIKIGAVLDITGAGASLGVPERQTLEMLADQVNSGGGVNGRKVKLIIEDDQSTEAGAAKAASKLLSTDSVDILLGASRTGPSLAMRPLAEQAKKPMISLASNQKIVQGSTWVFKTAQNDRVVMERLVGDMKASGFKNIAVARDASGYGEGIPELLTEVGKAAGIKVVKVEKFAPDATDFTAQMVNIRAAKPDATLIWGIPPAASLAQVAYKQLGITAPVYQSHGIGNQVFLDTAGASANGLRAALGRMLVAGQLAESDPQKPVVTKFISDYKAKYGKNPSTFAGHAYDGFTIAIAALKNAGTDPNKLRDAIESTSGSPGVSGVFNMTPTDHSGLTKEALVMVTVENGKWKVLDGPR